MTVEFLSGDQAAAYGRFAGEPMKAELERFFLLDEADRELIGKRRGDHTRLGFALQLCTVRFLGAFLTSDPLEVPWSVIDYLAGQLGIGDASVVKRYTERQMTPYEHAWEIQAARGCRDFSDPQASAQLREFMAGRAWTHAEGPLALFGQTAGWAAPAPGAAARGERAGPAGGDGAGRGRRTPAPHAGRRRTSG